MNRRLVLKTLSTIAMVGGLTTLTAAQAADPIRIGASAPKTGPLAGGAAVTYWPNLQLWVHQVNQAGGLKMKDGTQRPVELIEYDDRTNPQEAISAIQRLATTDKVDFIIPPYGTGIALATAPIFDRYGYPMINVSAITDQTQALAKRYERIFFTLGTTSALAVAVAETLTDMREAGQIGNKVALVNVADAFGIELAKAARPIFEKNGFDIVFDRSYPLGSQDLSPVMRGAKAASPDAFVAFSYPPDTFALTELAQVENLDVKAFYTAVATPFPSYLGRFGDKVNNVLGVGGVDPESEGFMGYQKAHKEVTGKDPDYWASPVTYASLQVLQQAIEGTGGTDKDAVTKYIKENTFDTIMGAWKFEDQEIKNFWTVGQWQNGKFHGIASTGDLPGAVKPVVKQGW